MAIIPWTRPRIYVPRQREHVRIVETKKGKKRVTVNRGFVPRRQVTNVREPEKPKPLPMLVMPRRIHEYELPGIFDRKYGDIHSFFRWAGTSTIRRTQGISRDELKAYYGNEFESIRDRFIQQSNSEVETSNEIDSLKKLIAGEKDETAIQEISEELRFALEMEGGLLLREIKIPIDRIVTHFQEYWRGKLSREDLKVIIGMKKIDELYPYFFY